MRTTAWKTWVKETLGSLTPFARPLQHMKWQVAVAVGLAYATTGVGLVLPLAYRRLTDSGLLNTEQVPTSEQMQVLVRLVAVVLLTMLVRAVLQVAGAHLLSRLALVSSIAVRRQLFSHLASLPLSFYDDGSGGEMMSRSSNDITMAVNAVIAVLRQVFSAPVMVIGSIAMVLRLDITLGLLVLAVFPLVLLLGRATAGRIRRLQQSVTNSNARVSTVFLEAFQNVRTVRMFHRQRHELDRFVDVTDEMRDLTIRSDLLVQLTFLGGNIISIAGFAAVLVVVGYRIAHGTLQVGVLVALIAYLNGTRAAIDNLVTMYSMLQQGRGSAERVAELLHLRPAPVREAHAEAPAGGWAGRLQIVDLTFTYPDGTTVFEDASLTIEAGEKVALMGPSGSGKSTLAYLVLGLYEPTSGRILLDGVDIRDIHRADLVRVLNMVPQDIGLFSGTVRENIAYARLEATDEEIEEAAGLANAHDFILRLKDGYATQCGDQAVRLSGGQRQRLAIARAILRNPVFLILDEATSHVDRESEALVQDALNRLMARRSALIIAHQESAIRDVSHVYELRDRRFHRLG